LAKARDAWLESKEADRLMDAATLGSVNPDLFLANRLVSAASFMAGAKAQEKIDAAALAHLKQLLKM
jgi:hypothetical protein